MTEQLPPEEINRRVHALFGNNEAVREVRIQTVTECFDRLIVLHSLLTHSGHAIQFYDILDNFLIRLFSTDESHREALLEIVKPTAKETSFDTLSQAISAGRERVDQVWVFSVDEKFIIHPCSDAYPNPLWSNY